MAVSQERTLTAEQVERLVKLRDNMLSVSAALGAEKRSDVTVAELTLLLKQTAGFLYAGAEELTKTIDC